MSNSTTVFNYSLYYTDFATKFIQDHEELPPWAKDFINEFGSMSQNRDDDIEDYLSQAAYVPSVGVIRSVGTPLADFTLTALSFEGIEFQSTGLFEWVLSAPTRITLAEQGVIDIKGNVYYEASAAGDFRTAQLYVNGITELAAQTSPPIGANPARVSVSVTYSAEAGDYLEVMCNQNSGGPLNITGRLSCSYLGLAGG